MFLNLVPVVVVALLIFSGSANPLTHSDWRNGRKSCTVQANGGQKDDVPNIVQAFEECGNGGTIVFPANQSYWIAQRFNPIVKDVTIEWRGLWTVSAPIASQDPALRMRQFSDNLSYWRANSYLVPFQNHRAGFVLTGDGIRIDGHGTGGINGNGDIWYNDEAGTTREGRPMPFVFWNVSDVGVKNFFVKDPQLWAVNIMNGTDMEFENILVNATSTKAKWGTNWVGNTDGFGPFSPSTVCPDGVY